MSDERPPFDLNDPVIRRWLVNLRVAFDDYDAVVVDMLRPLYRRTLGPVQHRALAREARDSIRHQLDAVLRPPPDNGGASEH